MANISVNLLMGVFGNILIDRLGSSGFVHQPLQFSHTTSRFTANASLLRPCRCRESQYGMGCTVSTTLPVLALANPLARDTMLGIQR